MADKMVKVTLRNSVGLSSGPLYGPGEVEVPEELAKALGLAPEPLVEDPTADVSGMGLEELRTLATARGVTVEAGGKRKEPNEQDYRDALSA